MVLGEEERYACAWMLVMGGIVGEGCWYHATSRDLWPQGAGARQREQQPDYSTRAATTARLIDLCNLYLDWLHSTMVQRRQDAE